MSGGRRWSALAWLRDAVGNRAFGGGVALIIAAIFVVRSCAAGHDAPEEAARRFIAAVRAGDKRAAWELLGPLTRARYQAAAEGATNRVGGTRRFAPLDMFDVSRPDWTYSPESVIVRERDGARAVVDVLGPAGRRDTLRLVEVDSSWRVELDFEIKTE